MRKAPHHVSLLENALVPRKKRLLASSVSGSHLFGTDGPDSDVDIVFIYTNRPAEAMLGNRAATHVSLSDDLGPLYKDVAVGHHISSVLAHVLSGGIDFLPFFYDQFTPEEHGDMFRHWAYVSDLWERFRGVDLFSQRLVEKTIARSNALWGIFSKELKKPDGNRKKALKSAEHALRLIYTLEGILDDPSPKRRALFSLSDSQKSVLRNIKSGAVYSDEAVNGLISDQRSLFARVYSGAVGKLPAESDRERILDIFEGIMKEVSFSDNEPEHGWQI